MSKKQVPKFLCYLTWFWILTKLILDQSSLIWKVVTVAHGTSVRESKSKRGPSFKPAGTFWIQHFPKNNVWTWTKPHCWLISGTTWQFDAIQVPVYPFLKPTYVVSCEALLKVHAEHRTQHGDLQHANILQTSIKTTLSKEPKAQKKVYSTIKRLHPRQILQDNISHELFDSTVWLALRSTKSWTPSAITILWPWRAIPMTSKWKDWSAWWKW